MKVMYDVTVTQLWDDGREGDQVFQKFGGAEDVGRFVVQFADLFIGKRDDEAVSDAIEVLVTREEVAA